MAATLTSLPAPCAAAATGTHRWPTDCRCTGQAEHTAAAAAAAAAAADDDATQQALLAFVDRPARCSTPLELMKVAADYGKPAARPLAPAASARG
jgi:hypothetical protein